jgi:hypothetical protein
VAQGKIAETKTASAPAPTGFYMKKVLLNAGKAVLGIVATAIITNLISGQPLAGLVKLEGLYDSFVRSSVPAWVFALVFLVALLSAYYTATHLSKKRPKGKVHFVPDAHNCGWAEQSDSQMDVRLGGTFTYDGTGSVMLLKFSLKGTRPTTDMNCQVMAPAGGTFAASQVYLQGHISTPAIIQVYMSPVVGTPGRALRRKVVFRDTYNHDFVVGLVEFRYIGGTATREPQEG